MSRWWRSPPTRRIPRSPRPPPESWSRRSPRKARWCRWERRWRGSRKRARRPRRRPPPLVFAPPPRGDMPPSVSTFPGQKAPTAPPPATQPPIAPAVSQPKVVSFPPGPTGYAGFGPVAISLRAYKPPRYTPREGDQVIPFDQRRRLIAEHMVYSKVTSPHVPCTAEVDMANLSRLRGEWKKAKETQGRAPSFL